MTKKVKAPLTYNPGKGRPKEHLAYLNYQEMQALKRLNGNNQERGPKGLPSFPPADAAGSSSKASSSKSSTSKGTGGKMGSSSSQSGGVSKASAAGKDSGAGRPGGGGSGAGPRSGAAGTRSPTSGSATGSGKGPSASKDTGGKSPAPRSGLSGTRSPTSGSKLSSSGQKPGGIADLGGGKRATGDTPGTKIKGAIQQVKQAAKTQPRDMQGPIPSRVPASSYGWAGTGPSMPGAYQAQGVYGNRIGEKLGQKQYDTLLSSNTITDPALHSAVMSLTPEQRRGAAALASAAKMQGLDVRTALEMGAIESGFGTVKNRAGSKYQGIGQMGPSEFSKYADKYSKPLGRNDLFSGSQASVAYMKDIANQFEGKYGTKPTTGDVYGRYQQGPSGFEKLTRNPDALAKDVVGKDFVKANLGKNAPKTADKITAGEFADYVASQPSRAFSRLTSTQVAGKVTPASSPTTSSDTSGIAGLTDKDAKKAAKEAGIPASVYNRPGFAGDVNQLGMGVPAQKSFTPTDMAKIHARAYGGQYLTPAEQRQAVVAGGIEKAVVGGANIAVPGTSVAVKQTKKAMGIETPKEFLSRPSYEQSYLRDVAQAENVRMGRDPLGRTSYTTADGQTVQRTGPSFGQGGDRGGIASLTVPTETVAPAPTESTTGTTQMGGPRPYTHFQWDLGLNVPKPTDPNYPDYQKYLASRAASAADIEGA